MSEFRVAESASTRGQRTREIAPAGPVDGARNNQRHRRHANAITRMCGLLPRGAPVIGKPGSRIGRLIVPPLDSFTDRLEMNVQELEGSDWCFDLETQRFVAAVFPSRVRVRHIQHLQRPTADKAQVPYIKESPTHPRRLGLVERAFL
jgi:hypothetical protein